MGGNDEVERRQISTDLVHDQMRKKEVQATCKIQRFWRKARRLPKGQGSVVRELSGERQGGVRHRRDRHTVLLLNGDDARHHPEIACDPVQHHETGVLRRAEAL